MVLADRVTVILTINNRRMHGCVHMHRNSIVSICLRSSFLQEETRAIVLRDERSLPVGSLSSPMPKNATSLLYRRANHSTASSVF